MESRDGLRPQRGWDRMEEGRRASFSTCKATRARGGSKTEEDGNYGPRKDGHTKDSSIGQLRRARRSGGEANKKIRHC